MPLPKSRPRDDRRDFYDRLAPKSMAPLWEVLRGLVPAEPKSVAAPFAWSYRKDVRALLLESGDLVTAEEAERRVLVLENPAMAGQSRITSTLYAGIQLILPGETAPAHRHTQSALRLVLEGERGFTAVGGERTTMRRGDFIITPAWAWHDHGNDGDGPVTWLDGLDVPLVNFLECGFREEFDGKRHPVARPEGDAFARYGAGLAPIDAGSPFGATSPVFSYPYDRCREALLTVASSGAAEPAHGTRLKYVNPIDGGWAMPTMATWLTHLGKGFAAKPARSTDGQVLVVVEGAVELTVGGHRFTLAPSDVAVVPAWTWRTMTAKEDSVLFGFSDRAVQEKLGLWREEEAA